MKYETNPARVPSPGMPFHDLGWMPSLALSFTRGTFRRDEKLNKGVLPCMRVDEPCAPSR